MQFPQPVSPHLGGGLDEEQRARLMQIADMCPIHRLLTAGSRVVTQAVSADAA